MKKDLVRILKNLESIGVVPFIEPEIGRVAELTEHSLRGTDHKILAYVIQKTTPPKYRGREILRGMDTAEFTALDLGEERGLPEAFSALPEKVAESDEERFKQELTNLLIAIGYPSPRIMSSLPIEGRRNRVSVISFETGDGRVDQLFVKEYDNQRDLEKRKDMVLPHFLRQRGVNTAVIIGYSPEEDILPSRLGFFKFDFPLYKRLGEYDYGRFVATGMLDSQGLINAGESILKLMARMHIVARKEQDILESRYGLHLPQIDYRKIIKERLTDYLAGVNNDTARRFEQAYIEVMDRLSEGAFIVHGDSTCHNFRWCGEKYRDIGIIDFELAEAGALPSYDLVTLINHTLSLREKDRDELIEAGLPEAYRRTYQEHFDRLTQELGVPGMRTGENETDCELINLSNHLLRVGDQVMAQAHWGESDARKHRAAWHLANFKVLSREAIEQNLPYAMKVAELWTSAEDLLRAAKNVSYLRPVLFTG